MKSLRFEIRQGVLLAMTLGAYFLTLDILGLTDVVVLRFLNAMIVLYFIIGTIDRNIRKGKKGYLSNLISAFFASGLGVVLSVNLVMCTGVLAQVATVYRYPCFSYPTCCLLEVSEVASSLYMRNTKEDVVSHQMPCGTWEALRSSTTRILERD